MPQDDELEHVIERRGSDGHWNEQHPVLVIDDIGTPFPSSVPLIRLEACAPGERIYALIYNDNDSPGERTRLWMKWEIVGATATRL